MCMNFSYGQETVEGGVMRDWLLSATIHMDDLASIQITGDLAQIEAGPLVLSTNVRAHFGFLEMVTLKWSSERSSFIIKWEGDTRVGGVCILLWQRMMWPTVFGMSSSWGTSV